jgi:hypothetical protein
MVEFYPLPKMFVEISMVKLQHGNEYEHEQDTVMTRTQTRTLTWTWTCT